MSVRLVARGKWLVVGARGYINNNILLIFMTSQLNSAEAYVSST